ncbi:MAG TPA: TetR/AcrR family transcriptional regulator [Polyangia bacterium]
MPRSARFPKPVPRRRRDAAAARALILDAAERQLVRAGPSGLRLKEVARDAGVSHPTVLHHFGNREALVKAVIARSLAALHARLVEAIESSSGEEDQLASILDGAFHALASSGQGRVMLWLALEGQRIAASDVGLASVVTAAHGLRTKRRKKGPKPAREDTGFAVVLASLALLGFSVIGETLLENAGLAHDPAAQKRFRAWLAHLLVCHLDAPG